MFHNYQVFKFFILLILFIASSLIISISVNIAEASDVKKGEELFTQKGCGACHTIGKGKLSGPDLLGVTQRREEGWLKKWLKSPDTMVFTDPIAKEMLKEFMVPMPNVGLTDEQVNYLFEYLKNEDKKIKK